MEIENEREHFAEEHIEKIDQRNNLALPISIVFASIILASSWVYTAQTKIQQNQLLRENTASLNKDANTLEEKVLPEEGVFLPVTWGDLGAKMVSVGIIDAEKFETLYQERGELTNEMKQLLSGSNNGKLKITQENSGLILNLLWALGLGNKNSILETGPMSDPQYGNAGNFASTGGWTIAKGNAMDHFSRHRLFLLSDDQQKLVERVSKNIYRPCCNNSTYFPDCNHGMAMFGLLELMASQGIGEEEMYKAALAVNSYWFPDTYFTIAQYFEQQGTTWNKVQPKEVLGTRYSSVSGYRALLEKISPAQQGGGDGCGVEGGAPVRQRQESGCGI